MAESLEPKVPDCLTGVLAQDLAALRTILEPCGDIIFRSVAVPGTPQCSVVLIYSQYAVDRKVVEGQILEGLMLPLDQAAHSPVDLPVMNQKRTANLEQVVQQVLEGRVALLQEGCTEAVLFSAPNEAARAIDVPRNEDLVRGPREAFVEQLDTNLGLLRRRLPTDRFRIEQMTIGRYTHTQVALVWLDGIAGPSLVGEVRKRLLAIEIDSVVESGYIEELIEDAPFSLFPQIEHTERPDKVTAGLVQGRVAVLTDGTPFVLVAPTLFVHFLQAPEDYYERYVLASFIRWVRYLAFILALLAPSLYVAIGSVHPEMIPVGLVLRFAGTREGAPYPLFFEALVMEIAFELLREAGIRLPKSVGQAVSIVGGLVIGEAAVRAGIANPITIVVVALTGIASFALPAYNLVVTLRLLRFPILIITVVMGLPGLSVATLIILTHLVSLRSFGVPYLSPLGPASYEEWKDVVTRVPWWAMRRRPEFAVRRFRIGRQVKPHPPTQTTKGP